MPFVYIVKVMALDDEAKQAAARNEVSLLANIAHANIVRYYDSFEGKSNQLPTRSFSLVFKLVGATYEVFKKVYFGNI